MNAVIGQAAWREYAALLECWGLDEANARGFTVRNGKVVSSVEFREGLTEEFYESVSPQLLFGDRIELATGVVRHLISTCAHSDSVLLQDQILHGFSQEFIDSLPALVESQGFGVVAASVKEKVAAFRNKRRKRTPSERACLFQRQKYGDTFFWHVRFVSERQVEEARDIRDNLGMHLVKWFLQTPSAASINSLKLIGIVNPPPPRPKDNDPEMPNDNVGLSRPCIDRLHERTKNMTAEELEDFIETYQNQIASLNDKRQEMGKVSDREERELQDRVNLVRELKKMRRDDFTLKGTSRSGCTVDLRRATDRVARNLKTCYAALHRKGMGRFVEFLKTYLERQGFGFRYLPPDPPIDWQF